MPRQYKTIFAICKLHGFDYKDKVAEFTQGRTDSLRNLTDGEFNEFQTRLARINAPARATFKPKPGDEQRKKMISIARQMGWVIRVGLEWKADMSRIDGWCMKYGIFKKKLNDHTTDELPMLVTIFEQVLKTYLTGLNK